MPEEVNISAVPVEADSLDGIPEAYRSMYNKNDSGKFVLNPAPSRDLEAAIKYQQQVNEFRQNNIKVTKERDEIARKLEEYKGVGSPEEILKLKEQLFDLREQDLLNKGDIDKFVKEKTAAMQASHDKYRVDADAQIEALSGTADTYKSRYLQTLLKSTIMEKANAGFPVKQTAMSDLLARASQVWGVNDEDGTLFARNEKGKMLGAEGKDLTFEEWMANLGEEAPHLFETGQAGGVQQPNASGTGEVKTNGVSKWIDGNDPVAMGIHAEAIAKGEMDVRYN